MNGFSNIVPRVTLWAWLLSCLVWVTGCAPMTPMLKQLESEKATRINLVVERGPFEYTVPTFPDSPFVGGGLTTFFLGTLSVQYRLDQAHEQLSQQARARAILTDHRQVFIAALAQQFLEKGVVVQIVPMAYGPGFLSSDRGFFRPVREEVLKLPNDMPAFYLNLDMGSCTVGVITPCIRSTLNSTGVVTAPGPNQKYRGFGLFEPNFYMSPPVAKPLRFESLEDAKARISEFDAEVGRLLPLAVNRMIAGLGKIPSK
jgi:hypothetical protein